ncbi:ABC transporter permease [Streptomyces sp. NPDC046261]|uniref:ABC transporter permease n=1 Tax=Streptomyces sp. NPDC046261 TaxID=3157200 RepID=UPI0034022028
MTDHLALYATATRYTLIEHARNRFAMLLVALFLPVWTSLVYLVVPDTPARMRLRSTGELLAPPGNQLTQITGALNAITLITGFMMFAATFSGHTFDRRLVLAGYPRTHLVLAKVTALILASLTVAAYATAVTRWTWAPRQPLLLMAAYFTAAMTYGALGVGFGAVLRREVEGMFALTMTSVLDIALQNPIISSGANSAIIRFLPSYGAIQTGTAAGFSTTAPSRYLAVQLAWFTAAALASMLAFHLRTRDPLHTRLQPL